MSKQELIKKIKEVEKIASVSRFSRMLKNPFRYFNAIFFREVTYRNSKKEKEVTSNTFFGAPMHLFLPSSTDIYLVGGKSHDSEIRLAKFIIRQLEAGDTFVDVGAHYGYFSLLASKLIGSSGKVFSFEASPTTYRIFKKNADKFDNVFSHNLAVSDVDESLKFYEFPNLYSEYNALDIEQFKKEPWFSANKPKEINIETIILDAFFTKNKITPKIIKIDVEGAEAKVIGGLQSFLADNNPLIVLEYLSDKRGNSAHVVAAQILKELNFYPFIIGREGGLESVESITSFFRANNIDSDNIVFLKK